MSTNKTFNKVQLDVKFTQATTRANLISEENISISFGKISKYFADLHSQAFTGYTHPTYTARTGKPTGNQTPGFGSTFTISQITSDGTGHVTAATDRTVKIPDTTMGAASADAAGSKGLVPAPAAGKQTSFLRGDGTWATPTNTNTTYTIGTSGNNVTLTPSSGGVQSITVPYASNAAQAIKLRSSAARTDSTVDTADTAPYQKYWVKIASCYTTGNYTDLESLWAVNDVCGNRQGILKVRARVEGTAGTFGNTRTIRWIVADNDIDVNRFAIVCYNNRKPDGTTASGTATVELWWKSTSQYASFSFVLLDETRRTGKQPNDWVLYDTSTYGQAALPTTGNITYSVAATILNSTTGNAATATSATSAATADLLKYSHTNEINFSGGTQATCYFNYRNADTDAATAIDSINYKFCNYSNDTSKTTITAANFVGNASSANSAKYLSNERSTGITYGANKCEWYDLSGNNGNDPTKKQNPTNDWYQHITMHHANSAGYYVDLAICFHSNNMSYRRISSGTDNGWVRVIDSSNIGSQSVASATKATQDESGNNIKATYAASFSISDHTITLKNKNGGSLGTVTVPDNNTTYTIATGDSNGQIKVTPSGGTAYNVSVKGLASAAYVTQESLLRARSTVSTDGGATGWSQIGINQYNNAYPDGVTNKIYSYGAVVSMPAPNARFDLYYNHNSSTAGAITNGLQYRTGWDNDKKAWRMLLDNDNYGSYMTYTSNRADYASSDTHILQLGYFVTDGSYDNCTILVSSAFWGNQHGSSDIINFQQSNNTNTTTTAIHVTMSRIRIGGSVGRTFYYKADNTNNRVYLYVSVTGGNSYGRWNTTVLQSSGLTTYWRPSMSENQANSGLTAIAYTGAVAVVDRNTTAGLTTSGIQYAVGQLTIGSADGNAKEGSNASYKLWSYPAGGTGVSSTVANIQNLRLYWSASYYRDIFISPNNYDIYHRAVENNNARDWRKILDSGNYTSYALASTTKYAASSSVGGPALSVSTAGGDVVLGTPGSSSDDSGDICWKYGNGQEKARLWQDNTYTAKAGPQYRIYKSDGTSLYSGRLPLADGTSASGTWGISITGNAATSSSWATARTLTLGGQLTGSVSVKGNANMTLNGYLDRAFIYDDNAVPSGHTWAEYAWHKFAEVTITNTWTDCVITFLVSRTHGGSAENAGILSAKLRTNGSKAYDSAQLKWLVRNSGLSNNDFVMVYTSTSGTSTKAELWCRIPSQYSGLIFTVLKEHLRHYSTNTTWTLVKTPDATGGTHGSSSYPTTGITGTIISSDGTITNSTTGTANRATYLDVVASNEIRFYNDNQFTSNKHFWLGYSWAAGSHYTPSGGSDTSSTTAPNITKFIMGNCSQGGLASVHAKTFILGNGSSPTHTSKTTTIATAATTTDRTITLPNASGTVALLTKGSTSFWGLIDGDASTANWIRATSNGFIPSAAASFFQTATSSLGTNTWYFKNSYIQYMNANRLILGAAKTADGAAKGQLKFFSGNGSDATGTVTLECANDAVHTGDYTVKLPTWNGTIPIFEKLFEGASNTVSLSYSDIDEYDVFLITVANSNATTEQVTVTSLWISNVAGVHDMPLIWGGAPTSSGGACNVTSGWIQLSKNSGTTTFVVAHKPSVAQMTSSGWTISSPTYNLYIRKIFGLKAYKRT